VVSFGAQALNSTQNRYTPDELELMSLALTLRQYEVLAIHRKITVLTDNAYLLHFDKWNPINNRHLRLVAYLLQFRLAIKHIKGASNFTADALSGLYQDLPETERLAVVPEPTQDDFLVAFTHANSRQDNLGQNSSAEPNTTMIGSDAAE